MLNIRKARKEDAEPLRELYFCHLTQCPPEEPQDMGRWEAIIAACEKNDNYHLLVGEAEGRIVSSVTLVIVPNLTHNLRPYALIENVVTHREHRGKGYARKLMDRCAETAKAHGCYKLMLMTGSKRESTLAFYESCGYNRRDKTGFVRWL